MTTLVTGGSGYFGEILVRRLLERGQAVRIFDRVAAADRPKEAQLCLGDVRDEAAVERAMQGVRVVHHNVAQVPLAKDRELFWSVNVDGTRHVLQAAQRAGVQKVVLTSSSAVHGVPRYNPVTERTLPRPREAYGKAKLAAERLGWDFAARGLDVSVVRPRTILGHGRLGIFSVLFDWVSRGRPVYLLGAGDNRYQFIHADDLAAMCLAAGELAGPRLLLAGTDRFGTMRELLEGLVRHAQSASEVRSLPHGPTRLAMKLTSVLRLSPLGDYHTLMYGRSMWFDIEPTCEALGVRPRYSNAEMIADSYDAYLAQRRGGAAHHASPHRAPIKKGALTLLEWLP